MSMSTAFEVLAPLKETRKKKRAARKEALVQELVGMMQRFVHSYARNHMKERGMVVSDHEAREAAVIRATRLSMDRYKDFPHEKTLTVSVLKESIARFMGGDKA